MYTYGDFCPLSRASEIYATRWTPLIIRNMLFGCRTFTEIRGGLPGISRSVLTQRLRMLEQHGIIERSGSVEYRLTEAGEGLEAAVDVLARWGEQWLDLTPAHYDAGTVLLSFCRHVAPDVLVTTSEWLTKWHIGRLSLGDALNAGVMELRGPLHLERMLATMGGRGAVGPADAALSAAHS